MTVKTDQEVTERSDTDTGHGRGTVCPVHYSDVSSESKYRIGSDGGRCNSNDELAEDSRGLPDKTKALDGEGTEGLGTDSHPRYSPSYPS